MVNSKRKGARGERYVVSKFKENGYTEVRRSVQYNGKAEEGQADIVGVPNIHVEVKFVERLNIYDAIDQAKRDCKKGEFPTVFHKKNNKELLVTMTFDDWIKLYSESEYSNKE